MCKLNKNLARISVIFILDLFQMGNNILTTAGAIILATSINGNESSELQELDLTVGVFLYHCSFGPIFLF